MRQTLVRVQVPYDEIGSHAGSFEMFSKKYAMGRITPLRPHRDRWFEEPPGAINVWISLGKVIPGNGIAVFAGEHGNRLKYNQGECVTLDQEVTRPANISLEEGDAFIFNSNLLHATELNHTHRTRMSISLRISLEDPWLYGKNPNRYFRVYPRLPLSFHLSFSYIGRIYAGIRRRLLTTARREKGLPRGSCPVVDDLRMDSSLPPAPVSSAIVRSSEIPPGRPIPISNTQMLVKVRDGGEVSVWKLGRRCPHEGADLALGHVSEGRIHCPWHNLPFEISTGRNPCKSLASLEARKCDVVDDIVFHG